MDSQPKTILVTGGLGYIGSHTVNELYNLSYIQSLNIQNTYEVVIIDNCSNCSLKVLEILEKMTQHKIPFYNVDITDKAAMEEQVFKKHPSIYAVIHFAGKKSVAESQKDPLLYYTNNITGTLNLVELCLKYNVNNFIFSSSACVYGNRNDSCTEEEKILSPINAYGRTKLYIENILIDVSRAHPRFKSVILRYCNPVAAHKSGELGENPLGVPANLFPVIENYVRGKIKKLKIFGNDYDTRDGTCIRDYVHVVDIAQGHIIALNCFNKENEKFFKDSYVIYNMGTNEGYSVKEVFDTYMEANGITIDFEYGDRRPGDAAKALPNCDKIAKELGWKPTTTLKEMCRDSYNFVKRYPNGIE